MAVVTCNFTIPGGNQGGKLNGPGFGGSNKTLNSQDQLQVIVQWNGSTPPTSLTGYFIVTAASGSNQAGEHHHLHLPDAD